VLGAFVQTSPRGTLRHLAHLPGVTDARELLQRLVGRQLRTISQGKPNTVLRVDAETVLVGTGVSPDGRSIPIEWLQDALDVLDRDGELRFDRSLHWYRRAAFIGAVLITLPDVEVIQTRPRLVRRRQTTTKS
jgi:hypothetical protein